MNVTEDPCSDIRSALRSQAERIESTAPPLHQIIQRAQHPASCAPEHRSRPRLKVGLAIGVAALAAGGVAAAVAYPWPRAADYRADDRSPELSSAVADKTVTLDEYKAGFERYRQCDAAAREPLTDVAFDESTSLYTFATTGSSVDEDCYVREFYAVDIIWQTDPSRPGYVVMPSAEEVRLACRSNAPIPGIELSAENYTALCDYINQAEQSDSKGG